MSAKPHEVQQFLNLVVQHYHTHGELLSGDKYEEIYGVPEDLAAECIANEKFQSALKEQGINLLHEQEAWAGKALTTEQLITANVMLDLVDQRSQKKKLQDLGITQTKYNSWLADPVYTDYLRTKAERMFKISTYEADTALIDKMKTGDVKALALYNEMTGRYIPARANAVQTTDVQSVIMNIIEIIDEVVLDTDIKLTIGNRIKQLISNQAMAAGLVGADPLITIEEPEVVAVRQLEL